MFASALCVFLCATAALATVARVSEQSNPSGPPRCGTTISDEKVIEAEKHFAANKFSRSLAERDFQSAVINVYFHVISKDGTQAGGGVSDSLIDTQMNVLNAGFVNASLSFRLASTDRTVQEDWFNAAPGSAQQHTMKVALHKGGVADLNVYSVGFIAQDHSGNATFPDNVANQLQDDGVIIPFSSMPGGALQTYNMGKTLTHEVGHWAGLYDTFQGGCEGDGDFVADTPAEASSAFGCPAGRDTCPDDPGEDPIRNFMDYTDDSCTNQFTDGQIVRLRGQLATFRGIPSESS